MMKHLLIAAITAISLSASADSRLDRIIDVLITVESNGKTNAINGNAVGVLQIKPVMVKEVNRILRYPAYTLDDRWDKEKSIEMAGVFYTFWLKRWGNLSDRELMGRWMMPNGKAPDWYKDRCINAMKGE